MRKMILVVALGLTLALRLSRAGLPADPGPICGDCSSHDAMFQAARYRDLQAKRPTAPEISIDSMCVCPRDSA